MKTIVTTGIALAVLAGAAPAAAQTDFDYSGGRPGQRMGELAGVGVPDLLPELRASPRARAFVLRNFDADGNGRINRVEADEANRAFIRVAQGRRDRFDWDARDQGFRADAGGGYRDYEWQGEGGYDRRGMRDYRFRQGRYGATLVIEDVLFETGSARLRPGAADRFRPLASYLRATPGVAVRIDGHTDSVGDNAANQRLSQARAAAVAGAIEAMGVRPGRVRPYGNGEAQPAASNASAQGRQLNRRVEVTLIDRQAREFATAE